MAVMEISLPSGYVMDEDSLPSLRAIKDVKKVETKEGGTGISLYFDKVSNWLFLFFSYILRILSLFVCILDDEKYGLPNCSGLSRLQSGRAA